MYFADSTCIFLEVNLIVNIQRIYHYSEVAKFGHVFILKYYASI
jgi:hypothetical protein